MTSADAGSRIPFNLGDAVEHHFDRPDEPQTIHLELHLDDVHLEPERFDAAWRSAVAPHPFARVRAVRDRAGPAWVVRAPDAAAPPVVTSSAPLDATRTEVVNRRVDLAVSPIHVTRSAADPRDAVLLAVNHSAMDGVSALHLLRAASLAYEGYEHVPNGPDARAVHDLRSFARPPRLTLPSLPTLPAAPLRLRPGPGARTGASGYEVCLRETSPPKPAPGMGGTVNDLLLATLHLTLQRWHGEGSRDISVMMPINLRPNEWRDDVVGNLSLMAPVRSTGADRQRPDRLVEAIVRQTTTIKRDGAHRSILAMPSILQRNAGVLARLAGDLGRDTAILSNLGRVDAPGFGGTGRLWFSPPASMPTGLAVGAATVGDRLHLGFRCRRCLMGSDDLARFADDFLDAGDEIAQSLAIGV